MLNGFFRGGIAALALASLSAFAPPAAALDPSYSGSWFNPPEAGSGFNLEIFEDDRALLFWYTYDDAGQAVWLYSEGIIDGESIDFTVYYADGMRFSDLDAADKVNRVWGSLSMDFQSCNAATITYTSTLTGVAHSPVGTRSHPVQRLVNIDSLPCRGKVEGYFSGLHRDPTLNGGAGAYTDLSGVLTGDGRAYFSSIGSEEVFVGTYSIVGDSVQMTYEICPDNDGACVPATATAAFASKDFVRGSGTSAIWGTQPFFGSYRTIYDRTVTIASLAGTYAPVDDDTAATFTVSPTGAVTGSNNQGCVVAGQLSQPNANFNLFEYEGTLTGCATDAWSGVVVNTDITAGTGDRKRLEFRLENNQGAMSIILQKP